MVTGIRQGQGGLVPPSAMVPKSAGKQAHPTREGLYQMSADRAEIYRCRPPDRIQVPILVHLPAVNDEIPAEV